MHRIFVGVDALLVPSRIEPCGLVQVYAQRYGAFSVAQRTGGLIDTIVDFDHGEGTGFLFDEPTAESLLRTIDRFRSVEWQMAASRAMSLVRDWRRPAAEYEQLYGEIRA